MPNKDPWPPDQTGWSQELKAVWASLPKEEKAILRKVRDVADDAKATDRHKAQIV
jgi:hypothetical protein